MNRTVILGGIMISLIVFWLIGFVNTLHDEVDVSHKLSEKRVVSEEQSYMTVDIHGNEVLSLCKLSLKGKKNLWNSSSTKVEMLELFPHFIEMKTFVEERIADDGNFKELFLSHIEDIELEYIGGSLSGAKAKASLSDF